MVKYFFIGFGCLLFPFLIYAQSPARPISLLQPDTLRISLDSAEALFLRQNLQLLAGKYNIDAAKAMIIQAKLYPNPSLSLGTGFYNPQLKRFFTFGSNGEVTAAISQLIILAGKRNTQIRMAETNYHLSEYQFFDLMKTLKYTLRTDFFDLYYLQRSAQVYDAEINALQQMSAAFTALQKKGEISEKEAIRIRAQLYSLQGEHADLQGRINDKQSELRLMLQLNNTYLLPIADTVKMISANPLQYPLSVFLDSAYASRSDLMIAKANTDLSRQNLTYQRSLAVPDITVGASYDQQGSYIPHYNELQLGFDIPLFSRNQGNIRAARSMITYNELQQQQVQQTVEEQVTHAVQKAMTADKLYRSVDRQFPSDFDRMAQEVLASYRRRNISLLDFLDFYDSYKQTMVELNTISAERADALEEINYVTGADFFN